MTWIERSIGMGVVSLLALGCGGSEVPTKALAETQASIRAAHEVGAHDTPKAALQLKIAQDGLGRAQKLNEDGEGEQARAVLEEARLDAELAVLLARQEQIQARAMQAKRRADGYGQAKSVDGPKVEE